MINWFFAIFVVCGFYFATLRLFCEHAGRVFRKGAFRGDRDEAYFFLFLSFLAWAVSSGLMALVLVWGYFTDASLLFRYSLNGAIGFVLFLFGCPILRSYRKVGVLLSSIRLERKEKFILSFIAVLLLIYLYRVTLPWLDMDETVCYGYLSKLIAGGRTFQDIFRENAFVGFVRSQLVQSWDALLYGLVNDTYLVRLSRLVDLFFCSLGIFTFLRLIRVGRFWSLVGIAGFLSIPELSYLALSLKVDSVVMMFELGAFLSIATAFIIYWHDKKSEELCRTASYLSAVALLLAVFAFANRFSGIIPILLCMGFTWFFLTKLSKRIFASLIRILVLLILAVFIAAPGYWVNLVVYNNPIYPAKCFWPFQNSAYTLTIEEFRSSWNITGLPQGILQIYLIFALGVGLELLAKVLPFLNCLPMTTVRLTSMGWPYPLIFCIFFWPVFARSQKVLNLIAAIFIYQLICWSLGLHYSRLFVASTVLTILAGVIMADQEVPAQEYVRRGIQKVLKSWIIFGLVLSLLFQFWWFSKHYWGIFLFGNERRYHAQVMLLKSKGYFEKNTPTLKEAGMLNKFLLNSEAKPVVYVLTYSHEAIHILFDRRIHIKPFDFNAPYSGGGKYLLINPKFLGENKTWSKQMLLQYFSIHVLTTPDTGWELYKLL